MSVSLFRRWRSQKFSDLVGQQSVVSTLQNVLRAGDPARAYLFCGPRGTGKTSSARIFAKALNCENGPTAEPCNECSQCRSIAEGSNLDVFEIDAASHTQVDKIRDFIVEKVHFTPVSARFKVYIIDEVHKLSTSSFNALLKTLEEPPSHVVFVLATTHPHEMPSTILSRCQRYDFRPLTATEAENHLKMIAKVENIQLDDDAAKQLARAADGSLRDALVLFEQADVFSESKITRESVLDLLGNVGYEVLEEMFTDLHEGNAASALSRLDEWIVRGRDLKRLAESFQDHLRMLLLIRVKSEDQSIRHLSSEERASLDRLAGRLSVGAITQWLRAVGEMLGQIRHGRRARLEWELFLVSLAHPESDPTMEGLERRLERVESGVTPTTSSGSGSGGGIDPKLVARLEALEKREPPQPSAPAAPVDDGRIAELERQIALVSQGSSDERRFHELENQLEEMAAKLAVLAKAAQSSDTKAPRESVAPPEPTAPSKVEKVEAVPPKPEAAPVAPRPTGPLQRDPVDDWLVMPDILVQGRISRSGQISLLDSMEEPSPVPPVEPSPPKAPEPTQKAAPEPAKGKPSEPTQKAAPEPAPAKPSKPVPKAAPKPAPEPKPAPAKKPKAADDYPEDWPTEPPPEEDEYDDPRDEGPLSEEAPTAQKPQQSPAKEPTKPEPPKQASPPVKAAPEAPPEAPPEPPKKAVPKVDLPDEKEFFRLLMQGVKEQDIRLHAVLADARLSELTVRSFELAVPPGYDWHFGKIKEGKKLLESVAEKLVGAPLEVECSIGGEKASLPKENEHEELVKRASGVFGGSSVVD